MANKIYTSEFELQKMCVKYLESLRSLKKIDFFTAIINETHVGETKYKTRTGFDIGKFNKLKKQKDQGLNRGLPDLFLTIQGSPFFIELKYKNNTCSEDQKSVLRFLNQNQIIAYLVYSFEEFTALIDDLIKSVNKEVDVLDMMETVLKDDFKDVDSLKSRLQKMIDKIYNDSQYEKITYFKKGLKGSQKLSQILDL